MSNRDQDDYENHWTPNSDREDEQEQNMPHDLMDAFRSMPAAERPQLSHIMAIATDAANEVTIDWDKIDAHPELVQKARLATAQNEIIIPVMESLWLKLRDGVVPMLPGGQVIPPEELPEVFLKLSEELFVAYLDRLVSQKIEMILAVTARPVS